MTRSLMIFGFLTATLAGCMNDPVPASSVVEPAPEELSEPTDGLMNENQVE
ncbi:hypothetical protein SAMN04488012_108100 [Palleronia salina]|uniref:Lipoprotein-attachment site-containing protein n=1 Tax=Palleronia salina TaxID=313368 RepID=A0A1M6IT60_9RHOB|nr:hypothetical protein [Palleronia salina]SHJ37660.1 hypothetical protein SAMN04488012_108100 [Palleronia salina]